MFNSTLKEVLMDQLNMYYVSVKYNGIRKIYAVIAIDQAGAFEKASMFGNSPVLDSGPYNLSNFWAPV